MVAHQVKSGLVSSRLWDHICNSIDATRSGLATGWAIWRDCRNPNRLTINESSPNAPQVGKEPVGFRPIARRTKQISYTNIFTTTNPVPIVCGFHKTNIFPGIYKLLYKRGNNIYVSESDEGCFYRNEVVTLDPLLGNSYSGMSLIPSKYLDGFYEMYTGYVIKNGVMTEVGSNYLSTFAFFNTDPLAEPVPMDSTLCTYKFVVNEFTVFYVNSGYGAVFFRTATGDGAGQGALAIFMDLTDLNSPSAPVLTVAQAGGDINKLLGISGIFFNGGAYEVLVNVVLLTGERMVIKFTTPNPKTPGSYTRVADDIGVGYFPNKVYQTYLQTTASSSFNNFSHTITNQFYANSTWDGTPSIPTEGRVFIQNLQDHTRVNGLPDYSFNQYEYVVFKSTASIPQHLVLLYPNTTNSDASINSLKPIFMRMAKDWVLGTTLNGKNDTPDRFFFDPVIPSDIMPLADEGWFPAIETNPGGTIDASKVWLRTTSSTVFIGTQTAITNKRQWLLFSDTGGTVPVQFSIIMGKGSDKGGGCCFLNNANFTPFPFRFGLEEFYYLGGTASYALCVEGVNTVTQQEHAFDLRVFMNTGGFSGVPHLSTIFSAGKIPDCFSLPVNINMFGDLKTILGNEYLEFLPSTSASPFDGIVEPFLLVRWA